MRKILGLLFLLLALDIALYRMQGGYSLSKITAKLPHFNNTDAEEQVTFSTIVPLLKQRFHFLSSGGTSFAFLGEDGKTILKLFKHQHLKPPSWPFAFSLPGGSDVWRIKSILLREKNQHHKRMPFFFTSCAIAYHSLREETGLLFLSLQKDKRYAHPVILIDRLGCQLKFDLSETEFAIQKRAIPLFTHLDALIASDQMEEAQKTIDSILSLITRRCQLGIADRDPNLPFNFGFIDGQVIEYDIGSFSWDRAMASPSAIKKELFFATFELKEWLKKHSAPLLEYLYTQLHSKSYTICHE